MRLVNRIVGKVRRSVEVVRKEGPAHFLRLSGMSLAEPLRSRGLRYRVASDAKQALSRLQSAKPGRGLFIDCGSNVGQGYRFFSAHYTPDTYDYILIEPNKNCLPHLHALREQKNVAMEIIPKAASVDDGYAQLFGPPDDSATTTHEGCSIVPDHNSSLYEAELFASDLVETFSLARMIRSKSRQYDVIVLKLDVEGAEYAILEDLIASGIYRDLFAAYVEFHSLYMPNPERREKQIQETRAVQAFTDAGIRFRRWI